ncbi:TonB-dependent receptor [Edaphobacter acidisoli]|nr:TonB-dependent receptor [Edaphobacter acidisoli]
MSCAGAGFAQSTNAGDISGTVTDTTGAAIPGATVTVLNVNTGVSKDYVTNGAGVYDTSSIVAGTYKITFSMTGFTKLVRSSITVVVGNTTVNAQLATGAVTQEVVVNTDVPLLKTENGEQTTTLNAETLSQLPQVGQDWSSFDILLPGAAGAPMGAQGSLGTGTSNGTMLAVNGNLPFSTVLADGAETTLPASANSDIYTQETIQEVQISASAFSAQYGVGGIMFNQISKGGSDQFHGSAYDYFQNDALNAINHGFLNGAGSKSVLRYNNFGGSIGGPILKQKLFFYFNYDKTIQHGGASAGYYSVPTAAFLGGDFTGANTIYDPATTVLTQATGTRPFPPDTSKTQTCPCYDRVSFATEYGNGNKIPANRIDPVAKTIQANFPKANAPGGTAANGVIPGNYTYTSPSTTRFIKYFGRLDYQITPNNRLTVTESEGDNPGVNLGAGICPIGCQTNDVSKNNAQISDVWSIGARLTNELRLGYTNQLNFFEPYTLGQGWPAKLGWQFAKSDNFPDIQINGFNQGCNGSTVLCSQSNSVYKEHAFDPSDVVTLVTGKHILHFGGEFLIYENNSTAWGNLNAGQMTYTGVYTTSTQGDSSTGSGYADFLLGQTQQWQANETPEFGARLKLPQIFVQDDYKVRPNLTLNLGLRYQIQTGWSEVKGNMASFDPTLQNTASGTLGAMWYGSTKAGGRSRAQSSVYNTFLPRVGFAWLMDPNTTVRGGFGLYAYNWSNDTYNGGVMGAAFGSKGNVTDSTNGITPVVVLGGTGSNLPYVGASTDPTAYNGSNVSYAAYHQPVGGSYQWNIQVQRQLNNNIVGSLAYVASHGHNLPWPVDMNQVPEGKLAPNDQQSRPYPQYGTIAVSGSIPNLNAISNYNSLQATIQQRLSHGLNFNFSYVWSHFLDDIDSAGWGSHSGTTNYQNAFNPSANYGNSNFDVRNAFKGNILYQLPFGRGRQFLNSNAFLDTVIGGWQLSDTLVMQSGQPFTATMSGADGSYSLAGSNYNWYPNVVGNPKLSGRGINQWFNETAFAVPTAGTFGNERRNQLTGPGLVTTNLSLSKTFAIWEQVRLQVRADADNAFNHPSYGLPANGISVCPTAPAKPGDQPPAGCSAFNGAIQTGTSSISGLTVPARTMQVSARLSF